METKAALYRQAADNIKQRRHLAETQAVQNREQLRIAAPEYEQLRLKLLNNRFEQARRSVRGLPRTELEEQAQQLQEKLDMYRTAAGFTEEQLVPRYTCRDCNDTGICGGVRCHCVEKEMRRLRREQINSAFPLELSSFERFSLKYYSDKPDPELGASPRELMSQVLEYCTAWAAHYRPGCQSLLLMGDAGLGKTHLALAMAGQVLDAGFDVVYVSAQHTFARLDSNIFESENEWMEAMLEADLLVLDDLGTEFVTPHTVSVLYQLVDTRMCAHRPTIYTTNIMTQQLLVGRYTEKVASRLLGSCELLQFFGDDVRLHDKKEGS